MLKHAAETGAASVTAFETTGWRGIIETDAGNEMPDRFPSRPGDVFPMYQALADFGEWRDGRVVAAPSTEPLRVEALAVETADGARHLLVASVAPEAVEVELTGLPDGPASLRRLDLTNGRDAMSDPAAFRAGGETATVSGGRLRLSLGAYAVARIDLARPSGAGGVGPSR
jgi:hypothetical protein